MTEVPTLTEMRRALSENTSSDEASTGVPTLDEMMHANALYPTDPDAYLEHYGVKGMKWGIRRSDALLGRLRGKKPSTDIKDDEGGVVGGIRAKSRAGAQKLKEMRDGSTIILEDADGATKVMSKQKDGTFKEVYLSADAERTLRTSRKAESELSDREINEAINRAQKIEQYNKLFNPQPNPNADLQARVDAMELQVKLRNAERTLNPPKEKLVQRFIGTVENGYGAYNRMDKAMNGKLTPLMKQMVDDLRSQSAARDANTASKVADAAMRSRAASKERKAAEERFWGGGTTERERASNPFRVNPESVKLGDAKVSSSTQRRVDDYVHNITTMPDPNNPFYNSTTPVSPAPSYLELEQRRN